MSKQQYADYLVVWADWVLILAIASAGISVLSLIFYFIKYKSQKSMKGKFDLASESEVKYLLASQYILAIGVFFFVNTLRTETVQMHFVWFFIRMFIGGAIATLHGYIAYLIFKYYYPGPLSKRLERLRYTPRINPKTGNRMKLLSEAEEDAYLDEGMQAEEDVFSVDYDVWIDPISGDTQIEKYKGHLTALECDRCGFQTLRLTKEEVIHEATDYADGELQQEYNCSYCGRIKRKTVKISKKIKDEASSTGVLIDDPLKHDKRIYAIKIEIHSNKGDVKNFDFQNLEQARHFLDEFNFDKLEEEV